MTNALFKKKKLVVSVILCVFIICVNVVNAQDYSNRTFLGRSLSPNEGSVTFSAYSCDGKGISIESIELEYEINEYVLNTVIFSYRIRAVFGDTYYDKSGNRHPISSFEKKKYGSIDVGFLVELGDGISAHESVFLNFKEYSLKENEWLSDFRLIDFDDLSAGVDKGTRLINIINSLNSSHLKTVTFNNMCYERELDQVRKDVERQAEIDALWQKLNSLDDLAGKKATLKELLRIDPGNQKAKTMLVEVESEQVNQRKQAEIDAYEADIKKAISNGDADALALSSEKLAQVDPGNKVAAEGSKMANTKTGSNDEELLRIQVERIEGADEIEGSDSSRVSGLTPTKGWSHPPGWKVTTGTGFYSNQQEYQNDLKLYHHNQQMDRIEELGNQMNANLDNWLHNATERLKEERREREAQQEEWDRARANDNYVKEQRLKDCRDQNADLCSNIRSVMGPINDYNSEVFSSTLEPLNNLTPELRDGMEKEFSEIIGFEDFYYAQDSDNSLIAIFFTKANRGAEIISYEIANVYWASTYDLEFVLNYLRGIYTEGYESREISGIDVEFNVFLPEEKRGRYEISFEGDVRWENRKETNEAILYSNVLSLINIDYDVSTIHVGDKCYYVSHQETCYSCTNQNSEWIKLSPETDYNVSWDVNTILHKDDYLGVEYKSPYAYYTYKEELDSQTGRYFFKKVVAKNNTGYFEIDEWGNLITVNQVIPGSRTEPKFLVFQKYERPYNSNATTKKFNTTADFGRFDALWQKTSSSGVGELVSKSGWLFKGSQKAFFGSKNEEGLIHYNDGRTLKATFLKGVPITGELFSDLDINTSYTMARGSFDLDGNLHGEGVLFDADKSEIVRGWFEHGIFKGTNKPASFQPFVCDLSMIPRTNQYELDKKVKVQEGNNEVLAKLKQEMPEYYNASKRGDLTVLSASKDGFISDHNQSFTIKYLNLPHYLEKNNFQERESGSIDWSESIDLDAFDVLVVDRDSKFLSYTLSPEDIDGLVKEGKTVIINYERPYGGDHYLKYFYGGVAPLKIITYGKLMKMTKSRQYFDDKTVSSEVLWVNDTVYVINKLEGKNIDPILETDYENDNFSLKNLTLSFRYLNPSSNGQVIFILNAKTYSNGYFRALNMSIRDEAGRQAYRNKKLLNYKFFKNQSISTGLIDDSYYIPEGEGVLVYNSGDTLVGTFTNGVLNGEGHLFNNAAKWSGTFVNDTIQGEGFVKWRSGDSYMGNFVDGLAQGEGFVRFTNGNKFFGEFQKGTPISGGMKYVDSSFYEGEVNSNFEPNGMGYFQNHDISVTYVGMYKDGLKHGAGLYEKVGEYGCYSNWINDKANGKAKITYSNGNVFFGMMSNDMRHGEGYIAYANQDTLKCNFYNNEPKGKGHISHLNGTKFYTSFKDGLASGMSIIEFPLNDDRLKLLVKYDEGIAKGEAILFNRDYSYERGEWLDSAFVRVDTVGFYSKVSVSNTDDISMNIGYSVRTAYRADNKDLAQSLYSLYGLVESDLETGESEEYFVLDDRLYAIVGLTKKMLKKVYQGFPLEQGKSYLLSVYKDSSLKAGMQISEIE